MVIKIRILVITTNKNHPKADTNVSVRGATSMWLIENANGC